MNICNLEVSKGLVAQKKAKTPQLIQVSAGTDDIHGTGKVDLVWHNVLSSGAVAEEPFATAYIEYGSAAAWLASWVPYTHLVEGRMAELDRLAEQGTVNRLSHDMAYSLFATNFVDYTTKFRGMQAVTLNGLEACADVTLSTEKGGVWTVPPYFIDSVAHLAGFIMNVSDLMDTKNNFCVTPGWNSMRLARPLVAGEKYQNYVKMIATAENSDIYLGDVYILQGGEIIGLVGGIKFRRYPRLLLSRFFSAPDDVYHVPVAGAKPSETLVLSQTDSKPSASRQSEISNKAETSKVEKESSQLQAPTAGSDTDAAATTESDSTATKAIALVANEAALELSDLHDATSFAEIGVDSLMSLVISEKFREELDVIVSGKLFLEYPTVGYLRSWLVEYYG